MKKEFKRETKMAMLIYGGIISIYAVILYIFSLFLFPDNNIGMITNYIKQYNINPKTALLMAFIFIAIAIAMYKCTKKIKSNYLKIIAIFGTPIMVLLLFKESINTVVIIIAGIFMIRGIYKITPKANKLCVKIVKFVLISTVVIAIPIIMVQIKDSYFISQMNGSDSYNAQGFVEFPAKYIYNMFVLLTFDQTIVLILAAILFISFATKEIIKEVLNIYKPTDKEIGNLVLGTVVIFFIMAISTSAIQYTYKMNMPKGNSKKIIEINTNIKNIFLDKNLSIGEKQINISSELNKVISKVSNNLQTTAIDDNGQRVLVEENNSDYEKAVLPSLYVIDLSKIMFEYNIERSNVTNSAKIEEINNKSVQKLEKLENRIIENNIKAQNAIYNLMLGLFAMFILIEIYEEIRIVQMLENKEKIKKEN